MSDPKPDAKAEKSPPPERSVVTEHETVIGGRTLAYTATAATIHLRDDAGEPRAAMFHVAYVLKGDHDPSTRPVTFCFNGGPGSSAVWLHLGALGPKRVHIPYAVQPGGPPYALVDNHAGLLDHTDLVFVDPVGTGFSRPLGEAKAADFHDVESDVASVGELVWRWLSRHGRWASPKWIAGESYGSTRAAALAHHLVGQGVAVNGLVLISLALDFSTFVFEAGNDLPNLLFLPTYAATAAFHGRLPGPARAPEALHAEATRFAYETWAPALLLGSRLPADRARAVAEGLHALTGLPVDELLARNLRIEDGWFAKRVLDRPGHTVGRLDARYTGPDLDRHAPTSSRDPSYDAPFSPYAAVINDHLRRTLKYETDEPYVVLSMEVNSAWSWRHGKRLGYVNVAEALRSALIGNPHLRVLVLQGLYDLATPTLASEYTLDHLDVDDALRAQIRLITYPSGHMMYLHPESLDALRADLVAFYTSAPGGG